MLLTRTTPALTVAIVLAALSAPTATADIPTGLTIAYDQSLPGFAGDVTSANKQCLGKRKR